MANVLFLEAPAGVGYSYATDGNVTATDDSTSLDNLNALKQFYATYTTFAANDLYVGGESYAGIYVPTLVKRIITDGTMPIKGMYIGNGYVDADLNTDTMVEYGYTHGVMSEQ